MNPLLRNGIIFAALALVISLMLNYARWFFGADLQQPAYLLPFVFMLQILVHWIGLRHEDPTGRLAVALMISNTLLFIALILPPGRNGNLVWTVVASGGAAAEAPTITARKAARTRIAHRILESGITS